MSDQTTTAVSNPMATAAPRQEAMVSTAATREAQEVQAMMVIAKRFPRDQRQAMDRILAACTRPTLAEHAMYSYVRGGADVTGPSIRLAEAIAQQWGNIQYGIRELEQRHDESTVEAFAWDTETNTRQVKVFQVRHERYTKRGVTRLEDPRDVYEMVANQGARRLRACILGIVPGDVVDAAVAQCEVTLTTREKVTPERIAAMLEVFGGYGVTRDQIEKRIQRRLDAMTPALLVNLGKIANSLRDGMSAPADWFETAAAPATEAAPAAPPAALAIVKPRRKAATPTEGAEQGAPATPPAANPDAPRFTPASALAAVEAAGCDRGQFIRWLKGTNRWPATGLDGLSAELCAACVQTPAKVAKAVSDWVTADALAREQEVAIMDGDGQKQEG